MIQRLKTFKFINEILKKSFIEVNYGLIYAYLRRKKYACVCVLRTEHMVQTQNCRNSYIPAKF